MVRDPGRQVGAAVRGHALGAPLERAREREVQLGALARQQVVDDDLAQQRVPERVAALLVGDHELGGDGLAHRVAQRARIDPGGLGEDRVIQPPAGREHAQRLLRVRGQPLDPQHQRVAQRRRERAAPVRPGREQLLGEQRVALRAAEQPRQQVLAGRLAEDVVELLGELGARQRLELHPAGAGVALELGQQRAQRVAAVQLVRAVGRDDQHALAAQRARQVHEEGARRAVGPVQVLDRDQQAFLTREQLEELEQGVEQARLRGRLVRVPARSCPTPGGSAPARRARRRRARRTPGRRCGPAGAGR